jgi:methylated-DNA-[protein]-cysteine S-methyltransferase
MNELESSLKTPRWKTPEQATTELVEAAARHGLVDVAYARVDSPLGPLVAAITKRGLVRLSYDYEEADQVLEELSRRISPRIFESPRRLVNLRRELDEYFDRRRMTFSFPIDWQLSSVGFTRRVLLATARVPYGAVTTYRDVARRAGSDRAARAAGNALGSNPIPIVVPCHRVVHSGGGLGGYTGGLEKKRFLLNLEAEHDAG